ncbi:MAG: hypothetical protein AAGF84_10800 [Planctomycetota bacterium]
MTGWACRDAGSSDNPQEIRCPACDAKPTLRDTCEACGGTGVLNVPTCLRAYAGEALSVLPALRAAADHHVYPVAGGRNQQTPWFLDALASFEALRVPDKD